MPDAMTGALRKRLQREKRERRTESIRKDTIMKIFFTHTVVVIMILAGTSPALSGAQLKARSYGKLFLLQYVIFVIHFQTNT